MKISRMVSFDMKQVFRHWFFYTALILSFLPAFGIAYSIKNLGGPFTIDHVTSFYALFGTILSVVMAMMLYTKDLTNETMTLMVNQKQNRARYLAAKVISSGLVGLSFGVFCALTVFFAQSYIGADVEALLYVKTIVNYTLFTILYMVLFFFISIFYQSVAALFVIAVLAISFLPNLMATALGNMSLPGVVETVIEHLPIYYLPHLIGPHNIDGIQYGIAAAFILVFYFGSYTSIRRQDY